MTAFRLPAGGRIDREEPLSFRFDGRDLHGFAGDTLASALLANGVHLVGRSFKYHRPRGIMAAGSDEPNALVAVGSGARLTPNLRATQIELFEGLTAQSQNRFPSLAFDIGAVTDFLSPVPPAGFYYKTFMWPRGAWHRLYEPAIRRAAGLGRAPEAADLDRYAHRFAHCDVLVVGAGPAGLAAARAAAEAGARVVLCDEQAMPGGSLLAETDPDFLRESLAGLARQSVTLLPRTTAFGYFPHNLVGLVERVTDHLATPDPRLPRERLWQMRAREVVLATGAIERPLVFPGNDRPGIMLADAARLYVARYAVRPGRRAVLATSDDGAYRSALALQAAGIEIAAIADLRNTADGPWAARARAGGLPIRMAARIAGTSGRLRVRAARLARRDGSGGETVACDLLLMSGGLTPSVHLFAQSRGRLVHDGARFLPGAPAENTHVAGACRGLAGWEQAREDGFAAGAAAARAALRHDGPRRVAAPAPAGEAPVPDESGGKAFVDFQNDVLAKDIRLATQEGYRSIEHIKRYTTAGMATDQGKTSNINALGIAAAALGRPVPEIGLTNFRMPYTPVTFATLAGPARGALFDPVRKTPMHDAAVALGAVFEDVGQWKRARAFPRPGETLHAAVARECLAVRGAAGLFDGSTLGKIEVSGPDAATFLERMYVNAWQLLAPGRCRYGVLLREDGFVLDDGVIGRLGKDRFHVTTTTGGAARVLAMMEDYRQTEWPALDVWLTSVTDQWAVIAVQGPAAREILAPLVEDVDLTFPHMSVGVGRVCGSPARLFRVSFTGERGYEVNVPADHGASVWQAIHAAGAAHGLVPYGTDAMHVLRAEKGFIVVGQEADGTATPDDVGLGWAIGRKKADFVGKRALARPLLNSPDRKQLVGLLSEDPGVVLEEGAQLVGDSGQKRALGHVTSSYASASLGRSIALAMLQGGRARTGQTIFVPMPGRTIAAKVVSPVFYDPEGDRLHG